MFEKAIQHVEETWSHVLHGNSTASEKVECGLEAAAGLAVAVTLGKTGLPKMIQSAEDLGSLPKVELSSATAESKAIAGDPFQFFNSAYTSRLTRMELPNVGTAEAPLFRTPGGVELLYKPSESQPLWLDEARILPNTRAAESLGLKAGEGRTFWLQPSGASHAGSWAISKLADNGNRGVFVDEMSSAGVLQVAKDGSLRWNFGRSFGTNEFSVLEPAGTLKRWFDKV